MGNACAGEAINPEIVSIEYFEGHGRPEPLRAMLHHAGVPFHTKNVGLAGWMMRKGTGNTGEMGQLPIVRYRGQEMQQFGATLRAIGIERGYYNPNDWHQSMNVDWIVDTWGELLTQTAGILLSFNTTSQKNPLYTALVNDKWKPFMATLETQLNRENTRFIAGNQVTIADCCLFSAFHCLLCNELNEIYPFGHEELNNYPRLKAYVATMEAEFDSFAKSRPQ